MFAFLLRLLGWRSSSQVVSFKEATTRERRPSEPRPALAEREQPEEAAAEDEQQGLGGVDNLDAVRRRRAPLDKREQGLLSRIRLWVEAERYDLPILPSTNMAAMDMAANPGADQPLMKQSLYSIPSASGDTMNLSINTVDDTSYLDRAWVDRAGTQDRQ